MPDNKLGKAVTDSATLTSLVAKKVVKETFTADPSSNVMNYVKFTAVMAGSIALKHYLKDQKNPPSFSVKAQKKYTLYIHIMYTIASAAIMVGGAVLNAVTFIGGKYHMRKITGDDPDAAQEEIQERQGCRGLPGGLR